ncbi:hypothetical protein A5893_00730 [Pedobacter psychrophilus]|uniref:DUF983 domain-containing protein n=1 Tax=Pedobacter psychrophilus TaxID=1826909 RepID=A0A179DMC4_9SPHI|nr:DUF983 domain-containing protein [Pedobacter psychrophilus]OAQ41669.1 hypothetical protein A5893_00730 [Pedobacter psychrophilus]
MVKTPQLQALLHAKCPRCRRGEMFKTSMYGFKSQKMYDNCPKCNLRYEIEPGYFYAAMYVGYAFNVALAVTVGIVTYLITGEQESPWIYVITIFLFSLVLAPLNFRYSRVILLYWLSPKIKYLEHYDHD